MLLILLTGLLYFFIALHTGFFFNKWFEKEVEYNSDLFKSLLSGTCVLAVYLNILSFYIKTDYWLLIPPFLLSALVFSNKDYRIRLRQMYKLNSAILFAGKNAIVSLAFLLALALFIVVPPYNTDSSGYHFLSILWAEKFSIVPGLANLFPQYGYNSSFFVLSAAFSFTQLFHQSIYSINAVLTLLFFLWILKKSYGFKDVRKYLLWLMLLVFMRQFPINLSSPSADSLASMLVLYVLFNVFEMKRGDISAKAWKHLLLLSTFAIIIKLSTLPLMIVGLIPLINRDKVKQAFAGYIQVLPLLLLIIVPWLARNIILSGYLVFPFPAVDLFSFDWKVPLNVAIGEKLHISQGPRMAGDDWLAVSKMSVIDWFPKWLHGLWGDNHFNFLLAVTGLLSPLFLPLALSFKKVNQTMLLPVFLIAYAGIWFWLLGSPDIRFGYHYLVPCIIFPLLILGGSFKTTSAMAASLEKFFIIVITGACIHYGSIAVNYLRPYAIMDCVVKPFKSPEYFKNNDLGTFRFVMLQNEVRLYIHDSLHHSINAPLPSCAPYRQGITMRGNKLQEGFKTLP